MKELALKIAEFLDSKKAENILVLDVANLTSIAEYFDRQRPQHGAGAHDGRGPGG